MDTREQMVYAALTGISLTLLLLCAYIFYSIFTDTQDTITVGWYTDDTVYTEKFISAFEECVNTKFDTNEINGKQFGECLVPSYNNTSILVKDK